MTPVLIRWRDSATESHMNWESRDVEPMTETIISTIGFLLHDELDRVELAMSYHEDEVAGRWQIPRCCIVSITEIRLGDLAKESDR